jgi:hypothetical protein
LSEEPGKLLALHPGRRIDLESQDMIGIESGIHLRQVKKALQE